MDLLLDFMWWVESTPEPQLELDTSVKWTEGVAYELSQWPPSTKRLFRQRLDRQDRDPPGQIEWVHAWRQEIDSSMAGDRPPP